MNAEPLTGAEDVACLTQRALLPRLSIVSGKKENTPLSGLAGFKINCCHPFITSAPSWFVLLADSAHE